jgi:hypothetical protein
MDAFGNSLDLGAGHIPLSGNPSYLYFDASALPQLRESLSVARLRYTDHPDSLWKQRLLDAMVDTAASRNRHRHQITGESSAYTAEGEYQAGILLTVDTLKVNGTESFDMDLSGLGKDDLVIVRRVDLHVASQKVSVKIQGHEIAKYDLTPLDRFREYSRKRFFDLVLGVSNERVRKPGTVRFEFAGIGGQPFSSIATRCYAKSPGVFYLSDVDYAAAQQSQSILRMDENVAGETIRMQDKPFDKGLGTHADSQIVYFLGGQFRTFSAHPGVDQSVEGGSVKFQVLADGKVVYESESLVSPYSKTEPRSWDIGRCQVLELRVQSGGDGARGDWACWADARVQP